MAAVVCRTNVPRVMIELDRVDLRLCEHLRTAALGVLEEEHVELRADDVPGVVRGAEGDEVGIALAHVLIEFDGRAGL